MVRALNMDGLCFRGTRVPVDAMSADSGLYLWILDISSSAFFWRREFQNQSRDLTALRSLFIAWKPLPRMLEKVLERFPIFDF